MATAAAHYPATAFHRPHHPAAAYPGIAAYPGMTWTAYNPTTYLPGAAAYSAAAMQGYMQQQHAAAVTAATTAAAKLHTPTTWEAAASKATLTALPQYSQQTYPSMKHGVGPPATQAPHPPAAYAVQHQQLQAQQQQQQTLAYGTYPTPAAAAAAYEAMQQQQQNSPVATSAPTSARTVSTSAGGESTTQERVALVEQMPKRTQRVSHGGTQVNMHGGTQYATQRRRSSLIAPMPGQIASEHVWHNLKQPEAQADLKVMIDALNVAAQEDEYYCDHATLEALHSTTEQVPEFWNDGNSQQYNQIEDRSTLFGSFPLRHDRPIEYLKDDVNFGFHEKWNTVKSQRKTARM